MCFCIFYPGTSKQLIDVVLVMGAASSDNFEKEKQVVLSVIEEPKNADIIYEIIQHGKKAAVVKSLKEKLQKEDLIAVLRFISWKEPGEALLDGVRLSKKSFEQHGRPEAKKVLVVFADSPLKESLVVVDKVGNDTRNDGVQVIGVVLGDKAEEEKIEMLAGKEPLKIDDDETPVDTGKEVVEQALKGEAKYLLEVAPFPAKFVRLVWLCC